MINPPGPWPKARFGTAGRNPMTKSKRQQRAKLRDRNRIRTYLYGSDRPGADGRAAFGSVSGASTQG